MNSEVTPQPDGESFSRFMIWVDGVGGFLVCTGNRNSIGQAVPMTQVAIPIIGDIDQLHARIESIDGGHLLQPIGSVEMENSNIVEPVALIHNRTFKLGESVSLRYRKPHSYSTTALIDFESRHRTSPWSDAVIIAGNTILLGPSRSHHVFCPTWEREVILIRREGQWFCRCQAAISIDSVDVASEGLLNSSSRVEGEDFSFSLEPVDSVAVE
jgi:hypothetical protein